MKSNRKKQLLLLLDKQGSWLTGKELSQMLSVSDRTIRSDIESINREADKVLIESNIRKGYRLNQDCINEIKFNDKKNNSIPQTSKERCRYILQKLLVKKSDLNITDLLSEIYISEYSLDNDLKKIKTLLESYPTLEIVKSRNHLSLEGSEQSKRDLYKCLLLEETKKNSLNINEIATLYTNFDLIKAKTILEEIFEKYNYTVNDVSFPSLILHIGVAIERMLTFNYINDTIRDHPSIYETIEFQIATEFFEKISTLYQIRVVKSEIVLLSLLLMGKKGTVISEKNLSPYLQGKSCERLVYDMLEHLNQKFSIDLSHDQDLIIGLTLHLESMIERSIKNLKIDNVYLQEIKRRYPMIFELALSCTNFLSDELNIHIEEAEIGFISLHLGMSYERIHVKEKIRVVLIVPTTNAILNKPQEKLSKIFSDYMNIVACLSYFEQETIQKLNPDLIICSVPLTHSLDIPTIQISIFITREDESKIFTALNEIEHARLQQKYSGQMLHLMKPEHFYVDKDFKTPQECIRYICTQLEEDGSVDEKFYNSVMLRENISSTSFIYNYAIPHAIDPSVNDSNIGVMILKRPIEWGQFQVKIVFLLAIKNSDNNTMRLFFEYLMSLSNDIGKLSNLLDCNSYDDFIKYFK